MKNYDFVIIGAGLIGVATAYEMSKDGYKVALIDAKGLGAGASTANTGMLLFEGARYSSSFSICGDSIKEYDQLEDELEYKFDYSKMELIKLFEREGEEAEARELDSFFAEYGFRGEILSNDDLKRLEPGICLDSVCGAEIVDQWQVDPIKETYAYFLKARQYGTDWYPYSPVLDFTKQGDKITGVITPKGAIQGEKIVLAAGAWTKELLAKLGVSIPQYYIHGTAMVTEKGKFELSHSVIYFSSPRVEMQQKASEEALANGWNNTREQAACEFCVSPDGEGNILISQRSHVWPEFKDEVPADDIRVLAGKAVKYFPELRNTNVIRSWIKPVPFVPDGCPFFGFIKSYPNLLVSSGFPSALLMIPTIAKMTKKLFEGESLKYDISEFDPARFDKEAR